MFPLVSVLDTFAYEALNPLLWLKSSASIIRLGLEGFSLFSPQPSFLDSRYIKKTFFFSLRKDILPHQYRRKHKSKLSVVVQHLIPSTWEAEAMALFVFQASQGYRVLCSVVLWRPEGALCCWACAVTLGLLDLMGQLILTNRVPCACIVDCSSPDL